MDEVGKIVPHDNELPSAFADRLGVLYSSQASVEHKSKYGQFFTPAEIARFMAQLESCTKRTVRILDPGCGAAVLCCASAEQLLEKIKSLSEIELVAYETDCALIPFAQQSLSYLKQWLSHRGVRFSYLLHTSDFLLANSDTLENQDRPTETFDLIICNPPYFKLSRNDPRVRALQAIIHGQPNIYSLFMYVAAKHLGSVGQFIFITPRSFASGSYFRQFRQKLFSVVRLETVHVFDSRKEAFGRDEVLQENIVISAKPVPPNGERPRIIVSASHGVRDLDKRRIRKFYLDELLDLRSYHKILHLPTSEDEEKVVRIFKRWQGSLNQYNIQISTGPVVAFRAKRFIRSAPRVGISFAPLYWLHNASKMKLSWPLNKTGKGEYIYVCDDSMPLLVPNKNYIFLRRFSSKDDHSRLIATPYFAETVDADLIGIENHLNYIYRPNGHLDRSEILGLSALLNSALFDSYFRTFNGNVNVSATELREMPLPPLETVKSIGNAITLKNDFTLRTVEEIVRQNLEFNEISSAVNA